MANYDSRDFEQMDFAGRFPRWSDVVGVDDWVRLIAGIRDHASRAGTPDGAAAVFREFDQFLRSVVALTAAPRTARVFVSHQRDDWREAERVAWHATEVGFEYWLDVHDPMLALATGNPLPPLVKSVLIAGVIEMGLLNSSHVVSLQTTCSRHSRWVPYEFGRAKARLLFSGNAASWFEKGIVPDPDGDYLSLAFCATSEPDLEQWFTGQPGARRGSPNRLWPKPYVPGKLPD
jgi:hypothetical protein